MKYLQQTALQLRSLSVARFNGLGGWQRARVWCYGAILVLGLAACSQPTPTPSPTPQPTATEMVWPTPIPPTATPSPTPIPLAAQVNGQAITLELYQKEVERCQLGLTAAGKEAAVCGAQVMETLITQTLIEQAAAQAGVTVSEDTLTAELAQIVASLGGQSAFDGWLNAHRYTLDEFRAALALDLLRAKQLAKVAEGIGPTAEHVHAQMLLVADAETAQALLTQLQNGGDFSELAAGYSRDLSTRAAGGDLGWFPRQVLTVPEIEAAAFALADGALSEIITTTDGYYIVKTLERDPARPLSPAAMQTLRDLAVQSWLAELRSTATIDLLVQP